jgi:hypothetical protein
VPVVTSIALTIGTGIGGGIILTGERRILEHDARGFLLIVKSARRPKIAGAAGACRTPRLRRSTLSCERVR